MKNAKEQRRIWNQRYYAKKREQILAQQAEYRAKKRKPKVVVAPAPVPLLVTEPPPVTSYSRSRRALKRTFFEATRRAVLSKEYTQYIETRAGFGRRKKR